MRFPKKLDHKLQKRLNSNAMRSLKPQNNLVDFSSNDYLGMARNEQVFDKTHQYLRDNNMQLNGATGSRLLSGNHDMYEELETYLCDFHNAESALVFNSGYDANVGFFSSVLQRGDIILYDEFIHASIRDGLKMSDAKGYKFKHNDLENLKELLTRHAELVSAPEQEIYIVTESIFSMDGDAPNLIKILELGKKYGAHLVVDEAHAVGLFGDKGRGIVQDLGIEEAIFARIITFGKAIGSHGAAILGSSLLKEYLVNFSRSLIYTTGLSPHAVATIKMVYTLINNNQTTIESLKNKITYFRRRIQELNMGKIFIESNSAIHCCVIHGNERVKQGAAQLQQRGFDVKPILSPTVPEGQERLRFCLHSYNSEKEIDEVLETLRIFVTSY
ncbi:pyridoxal phosphate-dependent aminotransferase family protein [Flavobacteriaceae bacterium S356]|uniref:Pyridoxal phosphate-dependent aminotransferase family protein n=1 Tax=Asprobacillus argus TaxID=3076534 RepID=A0ABU3LCQ6_9FLAO|nr:pyridoxal phosphate-dependent aminotransferase family protein [Flavobacteriaceae bacterium S356]